MRFGSRGVDAVVRTGLVATAVLWLAGPVWGQAGVVIDAEGVLRAKSFADPTGRLSQRRVAEARAGLDQELARRSDLRKVSLTRLEAALRDRLASSREPTAAMRHLAGLTRVRYVFFYPESGDVVIAGPAEAWGEDLSGRMVGLETGRPVLHLEDLVVALRAFPPDGKKGGPVVCSIDPTPEGLSRMQAFLNRVGGRATPRDTQFIVNGLRESLGMQTVAVGGVSPRTHLARVMVEADYRMKLIGIGLEKPPIKMASYVSKATPSSVARNALQRWYFVPDYECVRIADDGMAMELVGEGVKLVGEDEVVAADGSRRVSGRVDRASQLFVNGFTSKYSQLARKSPVFGQLRTVIDLLVAAAFLQSRGIYDEAEWTPGLFASEEAFPVETWPAPRHAPTAVNSLWKGNRLMTPVGGGVRIEAEMALAPQNLLSDEEDQVANARLGVDLDRLPRDRWWWD